MSDSNTGYVVAALILVVTLVIMIIIYFFSPRVGCKEKFTHMSIVETKLDTGDLMFFSGNTIQEKMIKVVMSCPFSHVAMVVKDPNTRELYLWEADVGQKHKKGPRFIRLKDKLKLYKGDRITAVMKLKCSPDHKPREENVMSIVKESVGKGMQDRLAGWIFSLYPDSRIYKSLCDDNKVYCSELIADTLQKLALITGDDAPCHYTPADFYFRNVKYQPEVSYTSPSLFSF